MFTILSEKMITSWVFLLLVILTNPGGVVAQEGKTSPSMPSNLAGAFERNILPPETTLRETQAFCTSKIPSVPAHNSVSDWETYAHDVRKKTLADVVYRGQASIWRDAKTQVKYLETIPGGAGYRLQKLRFEAVPGFWVPAILYLPETLSERMPVALNVNGHDRNGKAADYKQIRCINLAKRGVITLNLEWINMGQLSGTDNAHYRLNQLDLCGTSGLAPFYLSMKRGLDVLLSHPNADPTRVAVAGLSGGGWQTIFISALDTRVTLANPVAGYSSLLTRIVTTADLGDSEQQPVDLCLHADYTHLTALLAPRPALLTYNAKDNCCFVANGALPPLLDAASPVYRLYEQPERLRTHVNEIPGDHNFGQENREALYRMLGDYFFKGQAYDAHEIVSGNELKSSEDLHVPLPEDNQTLHNLATQLARDLPADKSLPARADQFPVWKSSRQEALRKVLRFDDLVVEADEIDRITLEETEVLFWKLHLDRTWTVPAIEFFRGKPNQTSIVVADDGKKSLVEAVQTLLQNNHRVIVIDPFYLGECRLGNRDFLYALMVSTVGKRPLGIQAGQLAGIAAWQHKVRADHPINLVAYGPRTSLMCLCAAAADTHSKVNVTMHNSFASLRQIIELNRAANEVPELFCFGLLQEFDIAQLAALVAPQKVEFVAPTERVKSELSQLPALYQLLGIRISPFK